jgi:hypothetical protein
VVQAVAPDARVVYVDNDPLVIEQGRTRLGDTVVDEDRARSIDQAPDDHVHMYGGVAVKER